MPLASVMIPHGRPVRAPIYRGLEANGFAVADFPVDEPRESDILVLWNRIPRDEHLAQLYEKAGAKVVIAEHGWVGENTIALCLGQHNGAGKWAVGQESRWPSFGIEVKPWREKGDHVLVVAQRGIGSPGVAMPLDWPETTAEKLRQTTDREIVIRPSTQRVERFEEALSRVHAVVVWASGAGVKALINGVPVFHDMVNWVGAPAAKQGIYEIEDPYLGGRDTMLHNLSWAMWLPEEVSSGRAFECLLRS